MNYESSYQGMPVISDDNADQFIDPVVAGEKRLCALQPRDMAKYPEGGTGFAAIKPFAVKSHAEVVQAIKEREANKSGLRHILDSEGVPVKDQNGLPYCWIYACVHTVECAYAARGEGYVALSATAAGTQITGGVSRGGYGAEGIDFLTKRGTCREKDWPEHSISMRHLTPQVKEISEQNIITDWGELPINDTRQLQACLLNNFPVAIGLPWWRHEVTVIDLVLLSGDRIGYLFDNSWSRNWGDKGRGVLTEEKARGDMFYPISVKPRDRKLLS